MNSQNPHNKVIAEKIESGQYYIDARKWYDSSYGAPLGERSYLIVIGTVASFIIYYAYSSLTSMLPLTYQMGAIITQQDSLRKFTTIHSMTTSYKQTDEALLLFHVRDYVKAREEYITNNIEINFKRVMALSTKKVFDGYQKFMDPRNPDSPLALYERHTTRVINTLSVNVISSNGAKPGDKNYTPDKAILEFEASISEGEGTPKVEKWVAELTFNFKGIVVDQQSFDITPMEFLITDYKSTRKFGE